LEIEQMQTSTQRQSFLDTIIPETAPDTAPVFCVQRHAINGDTKWVPTHEDAAIKAPADAAVYLSTMIAKVDEAGKYRNRQSAFYALHCVVLDDIGTKAQPAALPPSWRIESSEGNEQWGYMLDEPLDDAATAAALVRALYGTDATDGGGALPNKYVRLPWGVNGKAGRRNKKNMFEVRLLELDDSRVYTVDQLVEAFGLELEPEAATEALEISEEFDRVSDEGLEWLANNGHVAGAINGEDFITITCPWHSAHTSPGTTAGYRPIGRGSRPDTRAFHCFHDHCSERKTGDFLNWITEQGGPILPVYDPVAPMLQRYVLLDIPRRLAHLVPQRQPRMAARHARRENLPT
jgi:hypothetical protein